MNSQGEKLGGRDKICRRCSQLQWGNNRTSFFLIIVTIVIYSAVQYYSGDLVFVCGRMCVCVYTHAQMQRQTGEEEKKRAACVHTHKHIANARGKKKEKKKKKKIVELILRRRTPCKTSVLYVCWLGVRKRMLRERETEKRNQEIDAHEKHFDFR